MSADAGFDSHYLSVMGTLRYRLAACDNLLKMMRDCPDDTENWVRIDSVALQVRKTCELFLLGSSLAHSEDGNGIDLNHWHPKDAFRELQKFNEFPLPLPLEPEFRVIDGTKQFVPASKPMPFHVLSSIYGQCGNIIHAPTAAKVLEEKVSNFEWDKFRQWVDGFMQLLKGHILLLPEIRKVLVCTWSGEAHESPRGLLLEGEGEAILNLDELEDFGLLVS